MNTYVLVVLGMHGWQASLLGEAITGKGKYTGIKLRLYYTSEDCEVHITVP